MEKERTKASRIHLVFWIWFGRLGSVELWWRNDSFSISAEDLEVAAWYLGGEVMLNISTVMWVVGGSGL